jgi:hypothetical protein
LDAKALLTKLQPTVRFDSHEAFLAHDVRAMTDNASFRLMRADDSKQTQGSVIAAHDSGLGAEFLGRDAYQNKMPFMTGDQFCIDLGGPDRFVDKIGDYRQMERDLDPRVRNVVYGRAVGANGESMMSLDGDVWLQYWYFYLYNDAQFGGRFDLHEGDWEMVQFLVHDGVPTAAVYSQHAYAERAKYADISRDPIHDCPIVFSGRGSHASYFEPGLHRTHLRVGDDYLPFLWDAADGNGPRVRQRLVILDDENLPGWAQWGGNWGGTRPRIPGPDGDSPPGPIRHGQWKRPELLAENAITHEKRPLGTAAPVGVRRSRGGLKLRFDFTNAPDPIERLVLTARSANDPPVTETIVVDSLARGLIVTRDILDPQRGYAVDVSTISVTGVPTGPAEKPQRIGPVRPVSPLLLVALILRWRDKLVLWLSSTLARRIPRSPAGNADAPRSDDGRSG